VKRGIDEERSLVFGCRRSSRKTSSAWFHPRELVEIGEMLTLCISIKELSLALLVCSRDNELILELGGRSSDRRYGVFKAEIGKE
jgi:hypothetical protein